MVTNRERPSGPAGPGPLPVASRRALVLTVVGIGVYIVLDIVAQLLPPHYSPISQAESDLAVGPYGYVMTINFVVRGVVAFAFLLGLLGATRLGRTAQGSAALVAVWGAGAFVLAVFPADVGSVATVHGTIHGLTGLIAFAGGAFGTLLFSRHFTDEPRLRGVASTAWTVGALAVVMYFVTVVALHTQFLGSVLGLVERIFIGLVLLWMLVVSIQLLLSARGPSDRPRVPTH